MRKAVNKVIYLDTPRRLRDAVRTKRPEKWRTKNLFFLLDNALARRSVLVKDFLANNSVTTMRHNPYPPDLVLADFYLVYRQKLALKGRRLFDAADIVKNAMKELKMVSQNGFQLMFQLFTVAGSSVWLHKGVILRKI
jgi:hypothetical protein